MRRRREREEESDFGDFGVGFLGEEGVWVVERGCCFRGSWVGLGWSGLEYARLVWRVSGVAVLRRVGEVRGQLGTEGCTGLVGL